MSGVLEEGEPGDSTVESLPPAGVTAYSGPPIADIAPSERLYEDAISGYGRPGEPQIYTKALIHRVAQADRKALHYLSLLVTGSDYIFTQSVIQLLFDTMERLSKAQHASAKKDAESIKKLLWALYQRDPSSDRIPPDVHQLFQPKRKR